MKKLILTIITLSIITYTGCYDPDTATVRINLGNIPVAKHEPVSLIDRVLRIFEKEAWAQTAIDLVETVHIAAYSGNTIIATASIKSGDIQIVSPGVSADYNYVELNLPAGKDITILVVGETGTAENHNNAPYQRVGYYGKNTYTLNLKPGETSNVDIVMYSTDLLLSETIMANYDCSGMYISWTPVNFPVTYVVEDASGNVMYRGNSFKPVPAEMGPAHYFYVEFEGFNIRTQDDVIYPSCK